jgi:hypothetical protein
VVFSFPAACELAKRCSAFALLRDLLAGTARGEKIFIAKIFDLLENSD